MLILLSRPLLPGLHIPGDHAENHASDLVAVLAINAGIPVGMQVESIVDVRCLASKVGRPHR